MAKLEEPAAKPGDNSKYLQRALQIRNIGYCKNRPQNDDYIEQCVHDYFQYCIDHDVKASVTGLALACGVDRRTISDWMTGVTPISDRRMKLLKEAWSVINSALEDMFINGGCNPVAGIFMLKNNHNYRDQSDLVVTPAQPLGATMDKAVLEEKYKDLPKLE